MPLERYHEKKLLLAVDCVIFGFDGTNLKLLLIHRGFEPGKGKWSLMGGFVRPQENLDGAADRVLKQLTGLQDIFMEQLHTFGQADRDPVERTVSVVYFALVDINKYQVQLSDQYHPEWFLIKKVPKLIFDHGEMVKLARERLKYKATLHPILFELLPEKFTLTQLLNLYRAVYDKEFDKRNFLKKLMSAKLLIKQKQKEKESSRKGAYYYKLDKRRYASALQAFMTFLPNKELFK